MRKLFAAPALGLWIVLFFALGCASGGRVRIDAGDFVPLYGVSAETTSLAVGGFHIDALLATNQDFALFLAQVPSFKPGAISSILADANYLKHWVQGDAKPLASDRNTPVTNVSWFAARKYCQSRGGQLPTVLQWEYVAAASEDSKDASQDPDFVQKLLEWYGKPRAAAGLSEVGKSAPNVWGVYDLHGLIWEWTDDFNTVFVGGDNRRDGEQLKNLFCGDSAASSSDRANYAAFMRYALRSSLRGRYTMENLGFRCVYPI